jgi:hypothetical protein
MFHKLDKKADIKPMFVMIVLGILISVTFVGSFSLSQSEFVNESYSSIGKGIENENPPAISIKDIVRDSVSKKDLVIVFEDSKGKRINADIKISKDIQRDIKMSNSRDLNGGYNVYAKINDNYVKSLELKNLNAIGRVVIGLDNVPAISLDKNWVQVYGLNVPEIKYGGGEVQVLAKGTRLYRCADWNFKLQKCEEDWEYFKDVVPGEIYSLKLEKGSVGYGEIVAINAVHLDENYNFISNIYKEISVKDGRWSEPIYENEIVRVTFERNLTNGRMIDIYARSNWTYAYFDIYEAGTGHRVGRSGILGNEELQYVVIKNLSKPTDVFDFVVRKVYLNGRDNSSRLNDSVNSFIEFDFIHDGVINATDADGLIVYAESGVTSPRYRKWNKSSNFSVELTNTQDVLGNIYWVVLKANHQRDEYLLGTLDSNLDTNIQVYNGTGWGNLLEVSVDTNNAAQRSFDIAYEDVSGDALIVYEDSAAADSVVKYRIWNGSYSSEYSFTTGMSASPVSFISLYSRRGSDKIMMLIQNNANELYAVLWNGTGFDTATEKVLSTATVSNTAFHFDFAWEGINEEGLVGYGSGTDFVYRSYNGPPFYWSGEATIALAGRPLKAVSMCTDYNSGYIGVIIQDNKNVRVRMWDGSSMLAGYPTADATITKSGKNNKNIDCEWNSNGSMALFGYIDKTDKLSINYFNFTKPNTWSVANIEDALITSVLTVDKIQGLHFVKNPVNDNIMAVYADKVEALGAIKWNGTNFDASGTTLESLSECLNGDQECIMFDWNRYDPNPDVKSISPVNGTNYNLTNQVVISVNVTDNIQVDSVVANVTLPNGSVEQISLVDSNGDSVYNGTFNNTFVIGEYVLRIIVNDTSVHQNVNDTEFVKFVVNDVTNPEVFELRPVNGTSYNVSDVIEIAANVTDNYALDSVWVRVGFPNGSYQMLNLSNAVDDKYNTNFTIPSLLGQYNVTFYANDTSGNVNDTEIVFFVGLDGDNPSVYDLKPVSDRQFNVSDVIEISANVSDNINVDGVWVNLTYPNGSSQILSLSNAIGDKYNVSFTIPELLGQYNISYFANDTSGNLNDTETTWFIGNDTKAPSVYDLVPTPGSYFGVGSIIEISANVTDNYNVENVTVNITYPNGTSIVLNLSNAIGDKYNVSFTLPDLLGQFNVSYFANDSLGNVNNSEKTFFVSNDTIAPGVFDLRPSAGSNYEVFDVIEIAANVTDNVGVENVTANITYPNGTSIVLNLSNAVDDKYNNSFTIPNLLGQYNVSFYANDTSGNVNDTETTFFVGNDTQVPSVYNITPSKNSSYNQSEVVYVSANVTDNSGIDKVVMNLTYPDLSSSLIGMKLNQSNGLYEYYFGSTSQVGTYNVSILANDTSGNLNNSEWTYFVINDSGYPVIRDVVPSSGSVFNYSDQVNISANVTDNIGIDLVFVNVSLPNGSNEVLIMDNVSDIYGVLFNNSYSLGNYNFSIFANDTSGNVVRYDDFFSVVDVEDPVISDINCVPSPVGINKSVTCNATITDNVGISVISAEVENPLGTNITQNVTSVGNYSYFVFNSTSQTGYYNVYWFANDTSGNTRYSNTSFKVTQPVITVLGCNPNPGNVSSVINCSANVSSGVPGLDVSYVNANVTLPNGSVEIQILSNVSEIYNFTFVNTNVVGYYLVTWFANDTTGGYSIEYDSFNISDTINPSVFDLKPSAGSNYSTGSSIEISANVSDNINVDGVWVNLTYPNGTSVILNLTNSVGDKYNVSFSIPELLGRYNISYFANDTSGNLNDTGVSNFISRDTDSLNITSIGCVPSDGNLSNKVVCNATASDNIQVDSVLANVTLPNGSVEQQNVAGSGGNYHFNFTNSVLVGRYNVTWFVNDTSGNTQTDSDSFNISDRIEPSIALYRPIDGYNTSNTAMVFNFSAIDNYYGTLNCSLYVDGVVNKTNSSVQNNSVTEFSSSIGEGQHNWSVSCVDGSGNSNSSEVKTFIVDVSDPDFISLSTDPSDNASLDPGVIIDVYANVTDNLTGVDKVVLQYKLNSSFSYSNVTMSYNLSTGLYNASFNASDAGTYNLRLWANDSVGNSAYSNLVNISVEYDRTWERSPSSFNPITANLYDNVTLGNLTINNTGDVSLNFSIVSDSNVTTFNDSVDFSLAPGEFKVIEVNDSATLAGIKTVTLNISAYENATPASQTTTGSIVVAPGQPVLVVSFITPSGDTLSVNQGDTNVEFLARVENIGEGNATNVSLNISIPSGWIVTFGSTDYYIGDLDSGDNDELQIKVTVPSNFSAGTYYITANASGVNLSGTDLSGLGYIFNDVVAVTVNQKSTLGTQEEETGGGGASVGEQEVTSGVSSGGAVRKIEEIETVYTTESFEVIRGSKGKVQVVVTNTYDNAIMKNVEVNAIGYLSQYVRVEERFNPNKKVFVETKNILIVDPEEPVRFSLSGIGEHSVKVNKVTGNSVSLILSSDPIEVDLGLGEIKKIDLDEAKVVGEIPISGEAILKSPPVQDTKSDIALSLRNISGNVVDLRVHKLGYPSRDKIYFMEDRVYELSIFAPPYMLEKDYNVTLEISGYLYALDPDAAGFTKKKFVEYRTLRFKVLETSVQDVIDALEKARGDVRSMEEAGFPVNNVKNLLEMAEIAYNETRYSEVLDLVDEISEIKKDAFEADKIIREIRDGIKKANSKMIQTPNTERALNLTVKAFEREDFKTAIERGKEAQLVLVLETRGRVNLLWFISRYWWAIILSILVLSVIVFLVYKKLSYVIAGQRLRDLDREEMAIRRLMREAQYKYLREKSLSLGTYNRLMEKYRERLNKIKETRAKIRNKKIGLVKIERELESLQKEERELNERLRQAQKDYLIKGSISKSEYNDIAKSVKERFAEIAEEREALVKKLSKEKRKKLYKLLKSVDKSILKLEKSKKGKKRK